MPERIFISYSRKDEEFFLKLRTGLHAAGLSTWIDQHNIQSGTDWMASLSHFLGFRVVVSFQIPEEGAQS